MSSNCQRCGLDVPQGRDVCPNCGAAVRKGGKSIRCQHCYHSANAYLTICPNCGRELKPWRPYRALAIIAVVALLLVGFRLGGWNVVKNVGSSIASLAPPPATLIPTAISPPTAVPTRTPLAVAVLPTPTAPPPTATPTDTPSEPTATPTPDATETPIPEPTKDAGIYTVQPGDTPIGIASALGISVDELMAYNNIKDPSSLRINQELKIPPQATDTPEPTATPSPEPTQTATASPTATSTPGPTKATSPTRTPRTSPTATPAPTNTPAPTATQAPSSPTTYIVKPGDTLLAIANQFGRSVEAFAIYNNITDPTALRVNQELKIPPANYTPPPPTPRPPTNTPIPKATPTPEATPTPSISLSAPVLVSPGDETPFQGRDAFIVLQWQNPGGLPTGIENVLYISVVTGPGTTELRFSDPLGQATEFVVPAWLFDQGNQAFGRGFVWYVQAASITRDGKQVTEISPVSPPSTKRRFYWN